MQGFIGQKAMYSQAHSGVLAHFAAQGVDLMPYTDQIKWLFDKLLGIKPRWNVRRQRSWLLEQVSCIAAVEHYTAIFWGGGFRLPQLDGVGADQVMLDILRWHGSAEVEYKAVAFGTMKDLRGGYWRQVRHLLTGSHAGDAAVDSHSAIHVCSCTRRILTCRRGSNRTGGDYFVATHRGLVAQATVFGEDRWRLPQAGFPHVTT